MKIAVFDSGVGGLTVLQALQRLLPQEQYLYFADTANVPYGDLSPEKILQIATQALSFLQEKQVDVLVLACHTVSSLCLSVLEQKATIPIVGMVIPSRAALLQLPAGSRVAILGTTRTIESGVYSQNLPHLQLFPVACPSFVPYVEKGIFFGEELERAVRKDLVSLEKVSLDAVFLACTHYPLIKQVLQTVLGPYTYIDGASAVALAVERTARRNLGPLGPSQESYLLEGGKTLAAHYRKGESLPIQGRVLQKFGFQKGDAPSLEIYATADSLLFQKKAEHILRV